MVIFFKSLPMGVPCAALGAAARVAFYKPTNACVVVETFFGRGSCRKIYLLERLYLLERVALIFPTPFVVYVVGVSQQHYT